MKISATPQLLGVGGVGERLSPQAEVTGFLAIPVILRLLLQLSDPVLSTAPVHCAGGHFGCTWQSFELSPKPSVYFSNLVVVSFSISYFRTVRKEGRVVGQKKYAHL